MLASKDELEYLVMDDTLDEKKAEAEYQRLVTPEMLQKEKEIQNKIARMVKEMKRKNR